MNRCMVVVICLEDMLECLRIVPLWHASPQGSMDLLRKKIMAFVEKLKYVQKNAIFCNSQH